MQHYNFEINVRELNCDWLHGTSKCLRSNMSDNHHSKVFILQSKCSWKCDAWINNFKGTEQLSLVYFMLHFKCSWFIREFWFLNWNNSIEFYLISKNTYKRFGRGWYNKSYFHQFPWILFYPSLNALHTKKINLNC